MPLERREKEYQVCPCGLEAPLPPVFWHDRKISIQNFATLSSDENSKLKKLTNWIELSNPGSAKDLNKIEVTWMKGFETEVKNLCKFDFESFHKKT